MGITTTDWLSPRLEIIPILLRNYARWMLWRVDPTKEKKIPVGALGNAIDPNNPVNYLRFDEAVDAYQQHGTTGLGFALGQTPNCHFAGIDLDDVRDAHTGEIERWARRIIEEFDSYTEVSPSGTGVKIFITGSLHDGAKQGKRFKVETYDRKRYFAVTGHHLVGTPATIEHREAEFREFHHRLWNADLIELSKLFGLFHREDAQWIHITCPWADEHSSSDGERDTSLHLTNGKVDGFNCFHGHCSQRKLPDVLRLFGIDDARPTPRRELYLTAASEIPLRRVDYIYERRIPLSMLSLLIGREGEGKTLLTNTLAADLTKGRLPGKYFGTPRNVLIVTSEDDWGAIVRPRLQAAGAELTRVFRVDVKTERYANASLSLPDDLDALRELVIQYDIALIILDPIISKIGSSNRPLDTHKDAEVRQALEPLSKFAEEVNAAIVGITHVNKAGAQNGIPFDPMNAIMGSRAFGAVTRSALFIVTDPTEPQVRFLAHVKTNVGAFAPTLEFGIREVVVGFDDENNEILSGQIVWGKEHPADERWSMLVRDLRQRERNLTRSTRRDDVADYLRHYFQNAPPEGFEASQVIKAAIAQLCVSKSTIQRSFDALGWIRETTSDSPPKIFWRKPESNDVEF